MVSCFAKIEVMRILVEIEEQGRERDQVVLYCIVLYCIVLYWSEHSREDHTK